MPISSEILSQKPIRSVKYLLVFGCRNWLWYEPPLHRWHQAKMECFFAPSSLYWNNSVISVASKPISLANGSINITYLISTGTAICGSGPNLRRVGHQQ